MDPTETWTEADDDALAAEAATFNGQMLRLTVATRAFRAELGRSFRRIGDAFLAGWRRDRFVPNRCEHGRITSWTGVSRPGDRLPDIEGCDACTPNQRPLKS